MLPESYRNRLFWLLVFNLMMFISWVWVFVSMIGAKAELDDCNYKVDILSGDIE